MLRHRGEQLPAFRTGRQVVRQALGALRPPPRMTVTEAAERWRVLKNPGGGYSGPWQTAMAPYLAEPMDCCTRRDVEELCILGPSQFGKTEILLNLAVYEAGAGGADMLIFQPSQALALDFAERRLAKAFTASAELAALVGEGRGDDKRLSKLFRNGARCAIGWPVGSQLSSRPVPVVCLDELDSMPDDVEGEGDPVTLARQRTTTFGKSALVVTMSTPKRQDGGGIVGRWRGGDMRLWHWPCPHCGDFFTPGFDAERKPTLAHLHVRPGATEEEAREEAALACPACGGLIAEHHKAEMNARGCWLPAGATINAAGEIAGAAVRSRRRSYWFSGLAQRNRSWANMAAEYVAALRDVELRQDENALKTWWNTTLGAPFRSLILAAAVLEPEELQARAEDLPLGLVPAWAGFVTVAADIQGNRFDCQAVCWGPEGRAQVLSAWQIFKVTDAETGEERMLDPARNAADWQLLTAELLEREWPSAAGEAFRAAAVAVDTGGGDGVTGQAYAWWDELRRTRPELVRRVMLVKGQSRRDAPLLHHRRIEQSARGKTLKRGIALSLVNTEALKDQVDLRLRMKRPGPGWLHLPRELPARFWEEATAEVKTARGWIKQRGRARNESLDLLVYNLAAWHRRGGPRLDWLHPAEWHRPRLAAPLPPVAAEVSGAAAIAETAARLAAVLEGIAAPAAAPAAAPPAAPPAPRPAVPGRSRFWKAPRAGAQHGARF